MSSLAKKVRFYLKNFYPKPKECYICKTTSHLEIHHLYSISKLTEKISKEINSDEPVKIVAYDKEKFTDIIVLCKTHHKLVHDVFGKDYDLTVTPKVKQFIEKRRING